MSNEFDGRRVLVIGLGRSGLASCAYLLSKGARVVANDQRSLADLAPEVSSLQERGLELALGSHDVPLSAKLDLVVASPGVPLHIPLLTAARRHGIPIWGELELAYRGLQASSGGARRIVAVTGTKGKSTTSTLLARMLEAAGRSVVLAGNIGNPMVGEIETASRDAVFVIEASSFQLETIERFCPDVAILLDVTPDHLDWHPSFEAYVEAKTNIFRNQTERSWAVVYGGNPLTVDMANRGKAKKLYFDIDCLSELYPHVHQEGPWVVRHEDGTTTPLASLEEFLLPGQHNQKNAMAASAAASLLGISQDEMAEAMLEFEGLPHTLERVAEVGGVSFYNDSKATNIQAVLAALRTFESGVILILGGRFKGGDFRDLREEIAKRVRLVFAIGESQDRVADALGDVVPVVFEEDLRSAVAAAHRKARPGNVVLLSPAGSSFDMFADYRERGRVFRDAVQDLKERRGE